MCLEGIVIEIKHFRKRNCTRIFYAHVIVYSYFMLQQAIVQNIFPEVQVPTWQAIARGEAEGNRM